MYTSEIRETDHEGEPVAVSPALLARVRKTDDVLHERLGTDSGFVYTGRWVFPEAEKALLSLQVQIPNEPQVFTASLLLHSRNVESFPGRVIETVLAQAQKALQARSEQRLHDLLVSTTGE